MPPTMTDPDQLDAPYDLAAEQAERYRRDGFIKLKNALSPSDLDRYGRLIGERVAELNDLRDVAWDQRDTYQKAFIQVMNLWRDSADIARFVFSKRLARLAAELMGVNGVRLYHDQALFKEPTKEATGGHTPWHADQYYWPIDTPHTITAWIPLHAVPQDMGPLAFAAGSQDSAAARTLAISDDSEEKIAGLVDTEGYAVCDEPFDLGEVSFHAGWTLHRAGPNRSDATRRVMTVIYMDAEARVKEPENDHQRADLEGWIPGIKPGEIAASELNPVLWSR